MILTQLGNAASTYYGDVSNTLSGAVTNVKQSLGNWWDASVSGFQSESVGSFADRALQGSVVGPELGALGIVVGNVKGLFATESAVANGAEAIAPTILDNVTSSGIGYNSSRALRNAMSPAAGEQIHHIVEQTPSNIANFGQQAIQNTANAVPIAADIHIGQGSISAYYSSVQPFSQGLTVRKWLGGQSFDAQYNFGMQTLKDYGVIK